MPLNFSLGPRSYPSTTVTVTAEEIAAYAAASGDPNPRHRPGPGQVAPVVFPVVHGLPLLAVVTTDPDLGVDNPLMIVHGEEEIVHHRPVQPGDTLMLTPQLVAVDDKGKGATFSARVTALTPDGDLVNEQTAVIFVRGAGSGTERPASAAAASPEPGPSVAEFSSHIPIGMPAAYAAASGDHNPIHLDESVARMVGLPGVINHGLGTLSLVTAGLVERIADGDPTRVRRLAVRFTDMVTPGSDVTTTVVRHAEGFGFTTKRADGRAVITGTVEVG